MADHPDVLFTGDVDQDHRVRHRKEWMDLVFHNGPRLRPAAAGDGGPFEIVSAASHTPGPGQMDPGSAIRAGEDTEFPFRRQLEETATRRVVDPRCQPGAHADTRISAAVDGGGADVTRDTDAPCTWFDDCPR